MEIRALRPIANPVYEPIIGQAQHGAEQYLPVRYNRASTLVAELDGSRSRFDFELTTAP